MYTMVMMMAVTSGGDAAAFGRNSCHGGSGCTGAVVVAAPAYGYGGCTGSTYGGSCYGSSSCNGSRGGLFSGGFLGGLCGKKNSCHGGAVVSGCYGSGYGYSGSCHGGVVYGAPMGGVPPMMVGGCVPTVGTVGGPVMTPPVNMPKDPAKPMDPVKPVADPNKKQD